jgi:hypothetical protein
LTTFRLDIHYTLLGDTDRAHSELYTAAKQAETSIKEYQEFSKNMQIASWPKTNQQLMDTYLWEWKQWITTDFLDDFRSKSLAKFGRSKGGEYVLLRRHPILCGMMLFRLKLDMQQSGIMLCNAWNSLPGVLHLYNACLAEGYLKKPW